MNRGEFFPSCSPHFPTFSHSLISHSLISLFSHRHGGDICDSAGHNLARAVRLAARNKNRIVTAGVMVEYARGLIQNGTVKGHLVLHVEHPEMVDQEDSRPLELPGGARDVLSKVFPGDGSMVVHRLYGIGKGARYTAEDLKTYCDVTEETTISSTVLLGAVGCERAMITMKGAERQKERKRMKRGLEKQVTGIVEESQLLLKKNDEYDAKVNIEDGKKIMLGLTHSWRRELAPPAATWKDAIDGVNVLSNELVAQGWYGRADTWEPLESREGFMVRKLQDCERQGRAVRDRKDPPRSKATMERRGEFMQAYLILEPNNPNIKSVHKRNAYKWLESHSEDSLGFGDGVTETQMKTWVERARGKGEGADREPKRKRDKAAAAGAAAAAAAAAAAHAPGAGAAVSLPAAPVAPAAPAAPAAGAGTAATAAAP